MIYFRGVAFFLMVVLLGAGACPGTSLSQAAPEEAPFEIYGIVKASEEKSLSVYIPHIDQTLSVDVDPQTRFFNIVAKKTVTRSEAGLKPEDLAVISGTLQDGGFLSRKVSFINVD